MCPEHDRQLFYSGLDDIPIDENVLFEIQRHGFLNTRQWIPDVPFHTHFPMGSQVNKYESTAAFVYTQGSCFAFEMNRLCRDRDWDALLSSYGRCTRALLSYSEKMQAHYGQPKTLFRGMPGQNKLVFTSKYAVGTTFLWEAFSSVTTNLSIAYDFAGPAGVIFSIRTRSRGAPILQWSEYPYEEEYLLLPFQGFRVVQIEDHGGQLIIHVETYLPAGRAQSHEVCASSGIAYRFSRNLQDIDETADGAMCGEIVLGVAQGSWLAVSSSSKPQRYMPLLKRGQVLLRRVQCRERTDFLPHAATHQDAAQRAPEEGPMN
eukprot:CAMPEP_0168401752 /NCGR_PEP_ID=MMETSP0228-20121227/23269_1 /TAXON_ID=133427 /ORGANISM="Protoceratium reticulatum, Strain CCCM 535 (=CCMP 1889)" /LENGTH=317 /DNA_ID=CAMNT_0008415321 /DNA_START=92 /DNA_END=1042 /DNA_ORIENTATION=+